MFPFSVLMSVYEGDNPLFLDKSLRSIFNQTLLPNEIILIKDGILNKKLNSVIDSYIIENTIPFKIIENKKNRGLGYSLKVGVEACSYEIIARMDADDISKNYRFECQLKLMHAMPNIDVLGSLIDEFSGDISNVICRRIVPEKDHDIKLFLKYRSPFNHPTVVFKKSKVLRSGNYSEYFRNMQDYDLWIRMAIDGCIFHNIQESLIFFRQDKNLYKRRSGIKYIKYEFKLINNMKRNKVVNVIEYLSLLLLRLPIRIFPSLIRETIYKSLIRSD